VRFQDSANSDGRQATIQSFSPAPTTVSKNFSQ
jgi:hypothetical protein